MDGSLNRRGFFAFLAAAPAAMMAGLRNKARWRFYQYKPWTHQFLNPPNQDPLWLIKEHTRRMVDEMSTAGKEMGSSYNLVKTRTATEIMLRRRA